MSIFPASTQRLDPYKNFKFRLKWDGSYITGVSKVSPLKRTTAAVGPGANTAPDSNHNSPGETQYDAITLERGITTDTAFEQWANHVFNYQTPTVPPQNFLKDITLELYNDANQLVLSYQLYDCWPSQYTALPQLDAADNAIAIESLTLQIKGWERKDVVAQQPTNG